MSCFMARDSVPPQLTHSSSSELGNVLSWQPLTYHHRGRLPPFPGVSSKGPCLLGSWRPSKLSPISIHSPKLCSMWRSRFRGGFYFFFTLFTWEKHRPHEHPEPRPGSHSLAGTPADFLSRTGFPARAMWENQEVDSHPRPPPCCDLSSVARGIEATLTSFCFGHCSLAGLVSEFWQCGLAGARFGQNTKSPRGKFRKGQKPGRPVLCLSAGALEGRGPEVQG